MIVRRAAGERGTSRRSWLESYHSFSFAEYYDARHMGWRALRVINDDRIAPAGGFPTHGHRDMEIMTYVLEGALAHRDSLGNGSTISPGDVQCMSAGTGIEHSEFNASKTAPAHLLQIWILPDKGGLKPGYQQKAFPDGDLDGKLRLVCSADGRNELLILHQDVAVYAGKLKKGGTAQQTLSPGRFGWVQVASGAVDLNGVGLEAGDGAEISDETALNLKARDDLEILLFDLA